MVALVLGLALPGVAFAQASPSAYTDATRYDAAGRVVGTIAPDPDGSGPLHYAAVRTSYDAAGRVVLVEKGELSSWQSETVAPSAWGSAFGLIQSVATTYDLMSRKVTERVNGPDGTGYALTQYGYDALGRLQCTAVRMNPAAYGSLPSDACTAGTQGSQGADRITRNQYDAGDQLLVVTKAYGTSVQVDDATYTYSRNGQRVTVKDANGNVAGLGYDGYDRLAQWNFPSPTSTGQTNPNDYEAYTYDANGNRTSYRRRDGRTLSYAYDALNRVVSKMVPDGCAPIQAGACSAASATRDVYYGYDLRGLQLYARFDGGSGEGVTSGYDGYGELVSSTVALAGTIRTLRYAYDADGNRTQVTHPDGLAFTYSYDGLDRSLQVFAPNGGQITIRAYDAGGRMASDYGGALTYGYDAVGRLQSLGTQDLSGHGAGNTTTLGYNAAGQIASETRSNDAWAFTGAANVNRSYAVNGLNQYTSAGRASFGYDANGNLISDGTNGYGYDAENRLLTMSNGSSLAYDPLGRLFQTSGTATGVTQYLYDGDKLVVEYDGSGNILRRYAHGVGEDTPAFWLEGPGQSDGRFLFADHQGSIAAVYTPSQGATLIDAYDEYGIPNATNTGRFGYTGQAWLPELGLWYYKARMYSATLGRFMQTDPIGYKDQINLYQYVANDPVNNGDPSGESCTGPDSSDCAPKLQAAAAAAAAPAATTGADIVVTARRGAAAAGAAMRGLGIAISDAAVAPVLAVGCAMFCASPAGIPDELAKIRPLFNKSADGKGKSKTSKPGVGGKEGAKDVPSWAKGNRPTTDESGKEFADRLTGDRYGTAPGPQGRGANSEWNKIKKWGDRSFE